MIASRVEPVAMSDRGRGEAGGWPFTALAEHRTVMTNTGHESQKLAAKIQLHEVW